MSGRFPGLDLRSARAASGLSGALTIPTRRASEGIARGTLACASGWCGSGVSKIPARRASEGIARGTLACASGWCGSGVSKIPAQRASEGDFLRNPSLRVGLVWKIPLPARRQRDRNRSKPLLFHLRPSASSADRFCLTDHKSALAIPQILVVHPRENVVSSG